MAQLFFKYGTMNSGKSLEILKVKHNYEEQGKKVVLLTSGVDNRTEIGEVSSRVGVKSPAIPIFEETDIFEIIKSKKNISCVLVDESQFLKKHHVLSLAKVVDKLNIPVMAFGLKNDFRNQLFEGSENLLIYADKVEEIKTVCWYCNRKATMNLHVIDGKPTYEGEQIQIGGNDEYYSVCRHHYYHPEKR